MEVPKLAKVFLVPLITNADSVAVGLACVESKLLGRSRTTDLVRTFEPQIQSVKVGMDAIF